MIHGYHAYKDIWENPIIREMLICKQEIGNPKELLSVAFMKFIGGESNVTSHVLRKISTLCLLLIRQGGVLKCCVDGSRRCLADLSQGNMEIPCKLILISTKSAVDCEKLKKLVLAFLSKACDQEDECEIVGPMITEVRKDVAKVDETDKGIEWAEGHNAII